MSELQRAAPAPSVNGAGLGGEMADATTAADDEYYARRGDYPIMGDWMLYSFRAKWLL